MLFIFFIMNRHVNVISPLGWDEMPTVISIQMGRRFWLLIARLISIQVFECITWSTIDWIYSCRCNLKCFVAPPSILLFNFLIHSKSPPPPLIRTPPSHISSHRLFLYLRTKCDGYLSIKWRIAQYQTEINSAWLPTIPRGLITVSYMRD